MSATEQTANGNFASFLVFNVMIFADSVIYLVLEPQHRAMILTRYIQWKQQRALRAEIFQRRQVVDVEMVPIHGGGGGGGGDGGGGVGGVGGGGGGGGGYDLEAFNTEESRPEEEESRM